MDCTVTILGRVNACLVCVFVRTFRAFLFGLLKHFETLQSFMTKCSNLSDSLLRGFFFFLFWGTTEIHFAMIGHWGSFLFTVEFAFVVLCCWPVCIRLKNSLSVFTNSRWKHFFCLCWLAKQCHHSSAQFCSLLKHKTWIWGMFHLAFHLNENLFFLISSHFVELVYR